MATLVINAVAGWLTSAGIGAGIAFGTVTWATVAAQIGVSFLFAAVARKLSKRGSSVVDFEIDLDQPASVLVKRTAYGWARIEGTPWATIVRDGVAYSVWVLNSRPSTSIETVEFDNRVLTLTGDLLDYAAGATATDSTFAGHVHLWAGLGGQTGIPALILAEVGDPLAEDDEKFWNTDAIRGRTVLWARMAKGDANSASQRWQRMPPALRVTGQWTAVWDPRDEAQDPDDPDSWAWSDNHALCLIDALRFNPIARTPLALLHMPSLLRQADLADEAVPLKAGGTEPRYRVGGRIVWSPGIELYEALSPLDLAGGGGLVQIGGAIGYAPGEYTAPVAVIDDVLREAPLNFTALQRGSDLPRAIRAIYPDPGAAWEDASLLPIEVPGAGGWTGGDDRVEDLALELVPYPHQANRLAQIKARLLGCQKRIGFILLPEYLDLVAGANVQLTRPRPGDPRAGVYQITSISPGHWLGALDGLPFRMPCEAREVAASVWAWDPETDEQDVSEVVVTQPDLALADVAGLTLSNGYGDTMTNDLLQVIRVTVAPGVDHQIYSAVYALEYRLVGDPGWVALAPIQPYWGDDPRDNPTQISGIVSPVVSEAEYEVRVRAQGQGRVSGWLSQTISTSAFALIINAGEGP